VVRDVTRLTADSAAITFAVPGELAETFAFAPGQSLVIRRGEARRAYSICAPAGPGLPRALPRIGVREIAGGAMSVWLVRELKAGDTVDVQPPSGTFTPDLTKTGRHVMVAGGGGITPLLSIGASVLAADDESTVTLLYGNRRADTVMFADEIADLKDAYPTRMHIIHVLSREPREAPLYSGRLDRERFARLLPATVPVGAVSHWWLCGPLGMLRAAIDVLAELGVRPDRIHRELFWAGDPPPVTEVPEQTPAGDGATLTVVLDGRSSTLTLPPGTALLDGAQRARPELPFACKSGVCGTCRARLTRGRATMRRNYALEPGELAAGYILTCQALPASADIAVDYDA
jgi:ring-1,2-phenylacetyl-CoA epoxidase subunit PaaE